ncbi:hypothetical protein D3Z36_11650 [Lachnospiraceae bacterium]|nr:hypothetical protein [Lachnospiraceae bacterium]
MQKREIGSEFHIDTERKGTEKTKFNVFDYLAEFYTAYFDSGRSALRSLLENLSFQTVLLPDYICESVRLCFSREIKVVYYHINDEFCVDWDDLLKKCDSDIDIVYLHYFNGYLGREYDYDTLLALKEKNNFIIIEDTTHSFLSAARTVGDYCICSLRKWFPVADGGVLYSKKAFLEHQYEKNKWAKKKRQAMSDKTRYLQGDRTIDKQSFLTSFMEAEELLDMQSRPRAISEQSCEALKYIDIQEVIQRRRQNFAILNEQLQCTKVACNGINQVPLFFTICTEQRDNIRKFLIRNNIYCPIHWPLFDELKCVKGSVVKNKKELSIPIDQRYEVDDMIYLSVKFMEYAECKNKGEI